MAKVILLVCAGFCVLGAISERKDKMRLFGFLLLGFLLGIVGLAIGCNGSSEETEPAEVSRAETAEKPEPETPKPKPAKHLQVGEFYRDPGGRYEISVTSATLGPVKILKGYGIDELKTEALSDDNWLTLTIRVKNIHDRKKMVYDGNDMMLGMHSNPNTIAVVDDVENDVNKALFFEDGKPLGADSHVSLEPGEEHSYLEMFSEPLPKTEAITVSIKPSAFSELREGETRVIGTETVKWRIPVAEIEGFQK